MGMTDVDRTSAGRAVRHGATRVVCAVVCAVVVVGCSSDDPAGPDKPSNEIASVTVAPSPVDLEAGQTRQLTATPKNANGDALTRTVSWRSADTAIAAVNGSGLVVARKAGQTQIIAASGGQEGSATVRVAAWKTALGNELSKTRVDGADIMWGPNPAPAEVQIAGKGGVVDGLAVEVLYDQQEVKGWLVASTGGSATPTALELEPRTGILTPGKYTAKVRVASSRPGVALRMRTRASGRRPGRTPVKSESPGATSPWSSTTPAASSTRPVCTTKRCATPPRTR